MAKLISLLEQHLDRQPPTVVTQATTWWETVLAHVKLQESGLRVHLPVKVPLKQDIKHRCLFSKLAIRMGAYFWGVLIFMGC